MREKILLGGDTSTGKSMNLIQLAISYPNNRVAVLDAEDGVSKLLEEMGMVGMLPNLIVIPVTPDWSKLTADYRAVKATLGAGDWFCMDMMNYLWDFAQNYYSRQVFGMSPSEHLVLLKNQAKQANFGGFEGLVDWTVIKRMHNEELRDDALLWSPFNVMATTAVTTYLPVEKIPKEGVAGILAKEFGVKLEGEKNNQFRFDTIAILYKKLDANKNMHFSYKLAKDKGRAVNVTEEMDYTGSSFWAKYCQKRGISI
jgi:hypothetical protein